MSQIVSIRLPDEQAEQLKSQARRLGKTPSETGAQLIDEALRASAFAYIEFRNSPVGRQAYIKASTLAVWEVITVGGKLCHGCRSNLRAFRVARTSGAGRVSICRGLPR
jgi:hypothetical protein